MLEQFGREFMQLYPQARILVAQREDLRSDRRHLFVARCATGDWDAVIMSRTAFERIPLSAGAQRAYLNRELTQIREWITRSCDGRGLTVKRLEAAALRAEERLKSKLDGAKDPGINFESTGIDYLFIDEAHGFKNLRTVSNIPDAAIDGSMRASDLEMKITYLRERNGDRVASFATATPIANSITEAYVMQRYLRPDLLSAAGIDDFDSWAATFARTMTQIELAPEGGASFRQKTRFARFTNVPEMMKMWHVSADIKTGEELGLPVPLLAQRQSDGVRAPEIVVVPPSDTLLDYVAELGERADKIRSRAVPPEQDNMLLVSSDGRKAALDLRLVGLPMTEPGKITAAAARIAAIWQAHRDDVYPAPGDGDSPMRGSLQIVFCDLGTPADRWNVYDELRSQLAGRGLPRDAIRFIHEARTDRDKGELFAACRAGAVAVLVGSTEKMGVGTNVQTRAIALHHLDCPWRPADVAQREGRILRQGNLNEEVQILRYVTERSFDGYLFQTVERKARFIAQVMRGRLDVREIEDIGDAALSYNEVKALATGNPLLMDKADADAELTRLRRAERAYFRNLDALRYKVTAAESRIEAMAVRVSEVDAAIARRRDTRGDAFVMVVDGRRYDKRLEAGRRLVRLVEDRLRGLGEGIWGPTDSQHGELAGFAVVLTLRRVLSVTEIGLALDGVPESGIQVDLESLRGSDPGKLVTRLEGRVHGLEGLRAKAVGEIERLKTEVARANDDLARPFPQTAALIEARERVARIERELEDAARNSAERSPRDENAPARLVAPSSELAGRQSGEVNGGERGPVETAQKGFPSVNRKVTGRVPADSARSPALSKTARSPGPAGI